MGYQPEVKTLEGSSAAVWDDGTGGTGVLIHPWTTISQGDGEGQRLGNKIKPLRLEIIMRYYQPSEATASAHEPCPYRWCMTNGKLAEVTLTEFNTAGFLTGTAQDTTFWPPKPKDLCGRILRSGQGNLSPSWYDPDGAGTDTRTYRFKYIRIVLNFRGTVWRYLQDASTDPNNSCPQLFRWSSHPNDADLGCKLRYRLYYRDA